MSRQAFAYAAPPRAVTGTAVADPRSGPLSGMPVPGHKANIMHDRRVVRGSAFAKAARQSASSASAAAVMARTSTLKREAPAMAPAGYAQPSAVAQYNEAAAAAQAQAEWELRSATPPPVDGRVHMSVQTVNYLEDLRTKKMQSDFETQTLPEMDRPSDPLFDPFDPLFFPRNEAKDAATLTQADELFDFDLLVEPLLSVLCENGMEQAMAEVLEEEELKEITAHAAGFAHTLGNATSALQSLQQKEARREVEAAACLKQERDRLEKEKTRVSAVAAASATKDALQAAADAALVHLDKAGFFYDPTVRQVTQEFVPQVVEQARARVKQHAAAADELDRIVLRMLESAVTAHLKAKQLPEGDGLLSAATAVFQSTADSSALGREVPMAREQYPLSRLRRTPADALRPSAARRQQQAKQGAGAGAGDADVVAGAGADIASPKGTTGARSAVLSSAAAAAAAATSSSSPAASPLTPVLSLASSPKVGGGVAAGGPPPGGDPPKDGHDDAGAGDGDGDGDKGDDDQAGDGKGEDADAYDAEGKSSGKRSDSPADSKTGDAAGKADASVASGAAAGGRSAGSKARRVSPTESIKHPSVFALYKLPRGIGITPLRLTGGRPGVEVAGGDDVDYMLDPAQEQEAESKDPNKRFNPRFIEKRCATAAEQAERDAATRAAPIAPFGPAAMASLCKGDVIVAVDGAPVTDPASYRAALQQVLPGDVVTISVVRRMDGRHEEISVEVGVAGHRMQQFAVRQHRQLVSLFLHVLSLFPRVTPVHHRISLGSCIFSSVLSPLSCAGWAARARHSNPRRGRRLRLPAPGQAGFRLQLHRRRHGRRSGRRGPTAPRVPLRSGPARA